MGRARPLPTEPTRIRSHSYTYDQTDGALYIYLRERAHVDRTTQLSTGIAVDVDAETNVLGVEVLAPNHHPWGLAELARRYPSITEEDMEFLAFLSAATWRTGPL